MHRNFSPLFGLARSTGALWQALLLLLTLSACSQQASPTMQGYVEVDMVQVSALQAGLIEHTAVERGQTVREGEALFTLAQAPLQAARRETLGKLEAARAQLRDLEAGQLPSQIAAIQAQLQSARVVQQQAAADLQRMQGLWDAKVMSTQALEQARTAAHQAEAKVNQLEADLKTARLGSRAQQISAARANVESLQGSLAQLDWQQQRSIVQAPSAGQVFDVLFRTGEWVAAGQPVVMLMPPERMKIRAFAPEPLLARLKLGQALQVQMDGRSQPLNARLQYISRQAEYTPPVIYSRDQRAKLVYLIELSLPASEAAQLHPGQPVDVLLP